MNYTLKNDYVWNIDYRQHNVELANYINTKYPNSITGYTGSVRGYINLTLNKGCIEWTQNIEDLENFITDNNERYLVLYSKENVNNLDLPDMPKLSVEIYDRFEKTLIKP